jgi:hypothetical protein
MRASVIGMYSPAVLLHAKPNHFRSLEQPKMECAVTSQVSSSRSLGPAPVSSHFRQAIDPAHFLAIFQECFMWL